MRSRALSLAALALLVGICGWTDAAMAQALDAGKPPAQIFSGTCAACHRSPRGLVRNVAPGSLPGFMRQHYTTGNDMAGTMAAYVLGNGGTAAVAEPPPPAPKREPKQKAKSDAPEVAARTPEPKELSKSARQKAAKKGQPEPAGAAKDVPASAEPEKAETPKPDTTKPDMARPEPPAAELAKTEAAVVDCKVEEPAKQAAAAAADDNKPANGMPMPAATPPRQPTALLTLPGFPAPVAEPEPEPVAAAASGSPGCEPAANTTTAATRAEEPSRDQAKEAPKEQPAPAPAALAEAPKAEPLRSTATEAAAPAPALDIMQEEVHAPRPARTTQQKKRAP